MLNPKEPPCWRLFRVHLNLKFSKFQTLIKYLYCLPLTPYFEVSQSLRQFLIIWLAEFLTKKIDFSGTPHSYRKNIKILTFIFFYILLYLYNLFISFYIFKPKYKIIYFPRIFFLRSVLIYLSLLLHFCKN